MDAPGVSLLTCQSAVIIFKDVSFAYVPDKPIFENQNIDIASAKKWDWCAYLVALTTFINLLLGFFDLKKGAITIDAQEISTFTQESLCAVISFLPQDTTLFHDSILENIRYERKEEMDDEVISSA